MVLSGSVQAPAILGSMSTPASDLFSKMGSKQMSGAINMKEIHPYKVMVYVNPCLFQFVKITLNILKQSHEGVI